MVFNTGAALLDAIVLAVVSAEPGGTYGYKITQDVRQAIDVSESTLYPVQSSEGLIHGSLLYGISGEKPQILQDYGEGQCTASLISGRVGDLFYKDI